MNRVEDYLREGGSVCPFAAHSRRVYVDDADGPDAMRKAVERFAATQSAPIRGALLVVGSPDTFEGTKTWAREVFLELAYHFIMHAGATSVVAWDHVQTNLRPALSDDANPMRPVLACDEQPLFCICMAPVYPPTHPRYAPEPVVVVTWQVDIFAAFTQPTVDRVRAAMKREHGSVYDADELMLPLPTESP